MRLEAAGDDVADEMKVAQDQRDCGGHDESRAERPETRICGPKYAGDGANGGSMARRESVVVRA